MRKFNPFMLGSVGILAITVGCAQPVPTSKIANEAPVPIDNPANLPQRLLPNQVIQVPYENIRGLKTSKTYQTQRHGGGHHGGRFGNWGGSAWGGRYWGAGWGGSLWGGAYYNNLAFYPYGSYYYPYYFNSGYYSPFWSTPYYYGAGAYNPYYAGMSAYNCVTPNYAYPAYAAAYGMSYGCCSVK